MNGGVKCVCVGGGGESSIMMWSFLFELIEEGSGERIG